MSPFKRIATCAALLAACTLMPCCQQQKAYPVFFLTESDGPEGGAGFNVRYNNRYYTKLPMLSLNQFEKFRSFLNNDGSYGVELFVKKEYRTRLYTETQGNIGKYMLPVVNGFAFAPMKIDRAINDGELVIWGGLNGYDLKQLAYTVAPVNPEIEEKRFKDKNPRPKPEKPKVDSQEKDYFGRTIPEIFSSRS